MSEMPGYGKYAADVLLGAVDPTGVKTVSNIVDTIMDALFQELQIYGYNVLFDNSVNYISRGVNESVDWTKKIIDSQKADPNVPIVSLLWDEYNTQKGILKSLMSAGFYAHLGMGPSQFAENLLGTNQIVYLLKQLKWQTTLTPVMRRYWNAQIPTMFPDSRLAFRLLSHGQIPRDQFNFALAFEGWSKEWYPKIYDVMTTTPDVRLGFSMFKRGLMSRDALNDVFSKNGWDATQHARLFLALYRIPSLRNLSMMADYVPMPEGWVYYKLQQDGYTDADALILSQYLMDKPLREEKRNVTGRVLWDYQISRMSRNDVESALNDLGVFPREHLLLMQWGDMRNADELIDRALDLIEQKVRRHLTGFTTTAAISSAIQALGIGVEWANIVAEKLYYQYTTASLKLVISAVPEGYGTPYPSVGTHYYYNGEIVYVYANPIAPHTVKDYLLDGEPVGAGQAYLIVDMNDDHTVVVEYNE